MIKLLNLGTLLFFLISCQQNNKDGNLIWSDEFNDSDKLNTDKWNIIVGDGCPNNCGFGNNEKQFYTDSTGNVRVEDGKLIIEAHKVDDERSFTSAKLTTKGKGDWYTGYIEVKAKLPEGIGTWPAIWMLPTLERGMNWPADGEIDIMEHVGYNQGMVYGTIHTEAYNHVKGTQKSDSIKIDDAHENFHTYAIHWTEDKIDWLIDGNLYQTIEKNNEDVAGWPFNNKFHLILNLAIGGNWGGKYGIDDKVLPQTLEIDYVRVYKNKPME